MSLCPLWSNPASRMMKRGDDDDPYWGGWPIYNFAAVKRGGGSDQNWPLITPFNPWRNLSSSRMMKRGNDEDDPYWPIWPWVGLSAKTPSSRMSKRGNDEDDPYWPIWPWVGLPAKTPWSDNNGNDKNRRPFDVALPCVPKMDVTDEEKHYVVHTDIPGIKKEDVKVQVHNGMLNISGGSKSEKEEEGKDYIFKERCNNNFSRSIPLPENIMEDQIKANLSRYGTLSITIPKDDVAKKSSKRLISIE